MHLTNYAINKHSEDFIRDDESGSKRRIITLNKWFQENGYDLEKIWNDIDVRKFKKGLIQFLFCLLGCHYKDIDCSSPNCSS